MQATPRKEPKPACDEDAFESQVWMSMEKTAHTAVGDIIDDADVQMAIGVRGVAQLSSSEFFVYRVDECRAKDALREILRDGH